MHSVFELSKTRTGHKRDIVEEELRKQIDEFEDKLKVTNRELELFMKKDPPVLTMDEMRGCVQTIDKLDSRARECVETLKEINQEEVYLGEDSYSCLVLSGPYSYQSCPVPFQFCRSYQVQSSHVPVRLPVLSGPIRSVHSCLIWSSPVQIFQVLTCLIRSFPLWYCLLRSVCSGLVHSGLV